MPTRRRGHPPKPRVLRVLDGVRPGRINGDEPEALPGMPTPPYALDDIARELWDYHAEQVAHMGLVTQADREPFLHMIEAMADHRRMSRLLAESPPLIRGQKGNLVQNPLVRMRRDAAHLVLAYAREFGLTPSARTQLHRNDHDAHDAAARLLS